MGWKKRIACFELPSGSISDLPTTREAARELKIYFYRPYPQPPCPDCGTPTAIFHTITNNCVMCTRIASHETYDEFVDLHEEASTEHGAIEQKLDHFWRTEPFPCGHVGKVALGGGCYICKNMKRLSPRQAALAAGEKWYAPLEPCPHCGKRAPKRVENGICSGCRPNCNVPSPRQAAMAAGETWYTPAEPCKYCGQVAPRRVNNGSCRSCEGRRRTAAPVPAYRLLPSDTIMDRETATGLGLTAFRTGEPCKRGHRGWRQVTNGACIDCLKGKD